MINDAAQWKTWFLEGAEMTPSEARQTESKLENLDLKDRLQLLGYYETRHFHSKKIRKNRQVLIVWIAENYPRSPFLCSSLAVPLKSEDEEFFARIKQLWLSQMEEYPNDPQVIANAANQVLFSDKTEAKRLLDLGLKKFPGHETLIMVKNRIEKLRNSE